MVKVDGARPKGAPSTILLAGGEPGSARLRVETTLGSDFIEVRVDRATRVSISNPMAAIVAVPEWSFALLAGGTTQLEAQLYAGRERLVGHDFPHLVELEATSKAVLEHQGASLFVTPAEAGNLLLRPYGQQPALMLPVVASTELVGLSLDLCPLSPCTPGATGDDLMANERYLLFPRAILRDGRLGLGLEGMVTVASRTPDVCAIGPERLGDLLALDVRAPGTCELEAVAGEIATRRSWPVAPKPSPQRAPTQAEPVRD